MTRMGTDEKSFAVAGRKNLANDIPLPCRFHPYYYEGISKPRSSRGSEAQLKGDQSLLTSAATGFEIASYS